MLVFEIPAYVKSRRTSASVFLVIKCSSRHRSSLCSSIYFLNRLMEWWFCENEELGFYEGFVFEVFVDACPFVFVYVLGEAVFQRVLVDITKDILK
jgi:hypothetical protein